MQSLRHLGTALACLFGILGVTSMSQAEALKLESPAFRNKGLIPVQFTCEGNDVSPPLHWSEGPQGTKSFALIVDDPDAPDPAAPQRTWVHWVVYNIPADIKMIKEGTLPHGAESGLNDWKKTTWGGPCPPIGRHRYFYKLYALDTILKFKKSPSKADLESSMKGHILAQTELVGLYEKKH